MLTTRLIYTINTTWDGHSIDHDVVNITLTSGDDDVRVHIEAPFFNDPPNPGGAPGEPFDQLWLYEGNLKQHISEWEVYVCTNASIHMQTCINQEEKDLFRFNDWVFMLEEVISENSS